MHPGVNLQEGLLLSTISLTNDSPCLYRESWNSIESIGPKTNAISSLPAEKSFQAMNDLPPKLRRLKEVFHCLHPAVEGGDTVLVDGFNCVRQLKEQNPEAFEILSKRKIEHHYVEVGNNSGGLFSTSREKSVIELDSHGNVVQIR
ncbi:hypothetical protein ANCCAN_11034 [Ancylostoma caninum]|uniref:TauD/TfdA-like domain-containing protein n=1 Tax=Ancylostoma caninum TaxID=29170 RepID=A0A368GF39_ANCCA|nr:hypothetical protein ANCCAN_11034 [Ancylostoma caninum]